MRHALVVAALSAALCAPGGSPVSVGATRLLLRKPVTAIAADGPRVAYVFCDQFVGVWQPGARAVTQLNGFPGAGTSCPASPALRAPPVGFVEGVALAGANLAWILSTGGNQVDNMLGLADVLDPRGAKLVAQESHIRDDPNGREDRFGHLLERGRTLVFSSRVECGDPGASSCPSGTRPTLVSQTVWLVRPGTATPNCVRAPGPCSLLAAAHGSLTALAASSSDVALRESNGTITVENVVGMTVRAFPALATASAVLLTSDTLVALDHGRLLELSLATGRRLHSWPLPKVAGLQDTGRGLVAYIDAGELHLLRLRDGRDVAVSRACAARFGADGLFYSYTSSGPWPGRVVFVTWRSLPSS